MVSINRLLNTVMYSLILVIGLWTTSQSISIILSVLIYLYIGYYVNPKSSVHMMFFLGFSTFIFLPAILNSYYLNTTLELYFLTSICASIFLHLTRNTTVKSFLDYGITPRLIFITLCILIMSMIILGVNNRIIFPFFAFLIMLLSICFKEGAFVHNIKYYMFFLILLTLYVVFTWDGFGRTVVMGWLLLASLQFCFSINFKINKFVFSLAPGLAAAMFTNRDIFELKFTGFESSLYDSAYAPYRLASTFIDHFNLNGYNFSGFFDQMLFTFFIFIPRTMWPNKPYGFGYEYTVENLDSYLVDAGHSIASTLIGDHIYYLGYLGVLSSILVLAIIAKVTNILYQIKSLNGNGVIIFSSSMMVLVWGGMTSFSARVVMPTIIFIIFFSILKRLLTKKVKFIWSR